MPHSLEDTTNRLVQRFGDGRASAAEPLIRRFYDEVVQLAGSMLERGAGRAVYDADDAANSALARICHAAAARKLGWLHGREQFWGLVRKVVTRRILTERERREAQRRGGRDRMGQADDAALEDIATSQPSPDVLAMARMEVDRLLGLLPDDTFRRIAEMRLQGHTVAEVALAVERPISTVERKLRLIREIWRRA